MLAAGGTATPAAQLSAQPSPTGKSPEAGSCARAAVVSDRAGKRAVCGEGEPIFLCFNDGMETAEARRHASLSDVSPVKTGHI